MVAHSLLGSKRGKGLSQSDENRVEYRSPYEFVLEAKLLAVLTNAPVKGWLADAQRLANRIQRHWTEWFTFLDYPEVKADNNDAERALRPVVVHRKVTGGVRSDWGAQLLAQMFSFLETVRLQGGEAIASSPQTPKPHHPNQVQHQAIVSTST